MTEETPGFDEQQDADVTPGASSDDAAETAGPASSEAGPAGAGTDATAGLTAQLDQARTALIPSAATVQPFF
ncbi:nucleotide exchange factor GrpE, partial [Streptomyces albidoflavus]